MFVSLSSTPLVLSRHTRHMHRSIMSRESRLVESGDKTVKCSHPLTCNTGLAGEPCCLGEPWRSDPDSAMSWCLQSVLNSRTSQCKEKLYQGIHLCFNFCNISVYLLCDSTMSTFFFYLSFPEVIMLQNRSILKPAMLTYFIRNSYREDRWKIENFRAQCCSILLWNSRAYTGFVLLSH